MSWFGDIISEKVKQYLIKDLRDNLVRVKGILVDGYAFTIELSNDSIEYYELTNIFRAIDSIKTDDVGYHMVNIDVRNGNFCVHCEMDE